MDILSAGKDKRYRVSGYAADLYQDGGFVNGVSAGSIIFTNNLPRNLELLDTKLNVHCEASSYTGSVSFPLIENMKLSNTGAIIVRSISDHVEIIDD